MLWGIALGFDGMSRFVGAPLLGKAALVPLALGVAVASHVGAGELCSLLRLPRGAPGHRAAFWTLIGEVTALGLFTASLGLRVHGGAAGLAAELSLVGFVIAMVAGSARDLLEVQGRRPEARGRVPRPRGVERSLRRPARAR